MENLNKKNDQIALGLQKMVSDKLFNGRDANSFEPAKQPKKHIFEDGTIYVNDIEYGKTYPNSFLDIWYAADDGVKRPTIIQAHGGGFIFGDKIVGDPLANDNSGDLPYFKDLISHGYNVVAVNYCLAPQYRAPIQLIQYNQMIEFLVNNAESLNLDMENVILLGGSAGACLAAIYGLAICNEQYAKKIGFVPAIEKKSVKALVLDEISLSTAMIASQEGMVILYSAWYGNPDMNCEIAQLLDVAKHVTDEYIPAYLTASNEGNVFENSAKSLKKELDRIGVENELWFLTQEESEELKHGFMNTFKTNKYAKDCYEKMLTFVAKQVSKQNS